ncbi:FG-GAP repeat domain-containing protein [Gayadomonas joobiniege]|uniref:FG-GAP repeat domain-containing protein n=1 Tax=Gayadomonas joobiniege TaxID=1234606 RepID=UPI0003797DA9|nr:VCBS repeat-containing protein [Gayadomonas joobiniege]
MKKVIIVGSILVVISLVVLYFSGFLDAEERIRVASNPPQVQPFKEIQMNFTHQPAEGRFPFLGGAAIDVDSDGAMEIFVSGSKGQNSALFQFKQGAMVNIAEQVNLKTTEAVFGALAIDIDNDGATDLVTAQQDGPWLYHNKNGRFVAQKINVVMPKNSFANAIATADINKDGLPDLYVSNFVDAANFVTATFNDPDHAKPNLMLLNLGDGRFKDVTVQTGTQGSQNTFVSGFVDLDGDRLQDLVVANNTGTVEIFKNQGALRFTKTTYESGLGYWMGLGIGDIDKDGDQDLYISNIGSSIPESLVRGDLTEQQVIKLEWLLLQNDGDMRFSDATKKYKLDGYGFAWGGVFEDVNLDGELDLLVAQNYIKWPGHKVNKLPGKAFIRLTGNEQNGFYHMDELGLNNLNYGQSALIADINNDNRPDVFWLNMAGKVRGFINQSQVDAIKVLVPDRADYLGAEIKATFADGEVITKQVTSGQGMGTDSSPNVFFAVPAGREVASIQVIKVDGSVKTFPSPKTNAILYLN